MIIIIKFNWQYWIFASMNFRHFILILHYSILCVLKYTCSYIVLINMYDTL